MHDTVQAFVQRQLGATEVKGKRVLEVGALDVNGSVQPYLRSLEPAEYIAVDMRPGPGVNFVCKAEELTRFFGPEFDVVVCCEMLEHCLLWREAVTAMKSVLAPGGMLVLTTRSVGFPLHEYPGDYWRFSMDDMVEIFDDMCMQALEPDALVSGVFVHMKRCDAPPEDAWVFPKDLSYHSVYMMPGGQ